MFVSETYSIEDCLYANDGKSVGNLEVGSNVSCTSNGSYITITTSTNGEKDVKIPVTLSGDWSFETTIAELGTTNDLTFKVGSGSQWGVVDANQTRVGVNLGSSTNYYTKTISANDTLKITYLNGTMTVYYNNTQLESKSVTVSGKIGYYTIMNRVQKIKDIKLKPL